MTKFCPKCGGIMRIEIKNNKKIWKCPVCGYEEKATDKIKEKPSSLVPAEIREEEKIKSGVIKDKKPPKITIDEDSIKEALEILGGSEG